MSVDQETFDRGSARRAVFSKTIQHPLTLYPTAIGCVGVLAVGLFGATPVGLVAAVGGLSVGIGTWVVNYFGRSAQFTKEHFREIQSLMESRRSEMMKDLEKSLKEMRKAEDTSGSADQAAKQFKLVNASFSNFQRLLESKLDSREFTYGRYFVAAEQVYLSVLDNLQNILSRLQSVATIDQRYIDERLRELAKLRNPVKADEEELETLNKRVALRKGQLDRVNELLTFNEKALTEFDQTNTAIAEMKAAKGRASVDLETSMRELEELAKRAGKFTT